MKINKTVTTNDAFCLLAKAWNMVPKSVVLKSWPSVGRLTPNQERELKNRIHTNGSNIEHAVRPQNGSSTNIEKCAIGVRAKNARNNGEDWLKEIRTSTEHPNLELSVTQPQILVRIGGEGLGCYERRLARTEES